MFLPVKLRAAGALAAAAVVTSAGLASAQTPAPPGDGGVAPPPPVFFKPVFTPLVPPEGGRVVPEPPSGENESPALPTEPPEKSSRFLLQVAAGARYRRMYSADLSAFQLEITAGARVRTWFHPSGFLLGAIGSTNQGLGARFLSGGTELAFPRAGSSSAFWDRVTPALRFRVSFTDIDRITRSKSIFGAGLGADLQLAGDLYRTGPHAVYALLRGGIDAYLTEGEGFSIFSGFFTYGGEAMIGFRY